MQGLKIYVCDCTYRLNELICDSLMNHLIYSDLSKNLTYHQNKFLNEIIYICYSSFHFLHAFYGAGAVSTVHITRIRITRWERDGMHRKK